MQETGAHSTQPGDLEDVTALCAKCADVAARWAPIAADLWAASGHGDGSSDAVAEEPLAEALVRTV